MVSSNNPITPAATAQPAAPAPAVAAAAPAVSTQVQIGGQVFELRDMPVAAGLRLYNALPAENKAEADRLAYVVNTFMKVERAASKHGIDPTQLAETWIKTGNDTAAKNALPPEQQEAIQELDDSGVKFGDLVHMVPGGDTMIAAGNVANGVGAVVSGATGIATAGLDGVVNGAPRVWDLLKTMGTEARGKLFGYGGPSSDDADPAKVFAAATVALRMDAEAKRHAMPMITVPFVGGPSQVWSNPLQYGLAGIQTIGDWLAQHIPGAEYVMGAFKWLTAPSANKQSYSQYVEQAKAEIEEAKVKSPTDFAHLGKHFTQRADVAMYEREGDQVRDTLVAAQTIAGLPTAGLATAATAPQVTYRDGDGVDTTLDHGAVTQQVTAGQRIGNAVNVVTGEGNIAEQTARVALSGGAIGLAANGARGLVEGAAAHGINAPAREAAKATARAEKIEGRLETAEARGPKTHAWEIHKTTAAKQESMRVEADALRAKAETAGAKAALRKAGTGEFIAGASTPLKEIKETMHLPEFLGGGKVPGWLATTINAPRAIGRATGHVVGSVASGTKSLIFGVFPGARDVATGFTKGVDHVVNSRAGQVAAEGLEATGSFLGKSASHAIKIFDPAIEGTRLAGDIGRGDGGAAATHGVATAAMVGAIVKVGAKRAVPVLSPIMDTGELIVSARNGDKGGMIRSGTSLGTTAAGAGIGAAIGVWFFGVGAIPGAAVGATVGSIVGMVTGPTAEHFLTPKEKPAQAAVAPVQAVRPAPAAPAQQAALTNAELVASHEGVIAHARREMGLMASNFSKLTGFNLGFGAVHQTTIGGFTPGSNGGTAQVPAPQQRANV